MCSGAVYGLWSLNKSTMRETNRSSCHQKQNGDCGGHASLKHFFNLLQAKYIIYGLVHERHNSIANALELCLSYTDPSKWRLQCPWPLETFLHFTTKWFITVSTYTNSAIHNLTGKITTNQWVFRRDITPLIHIFLHKLLKHFHIYFHA